MSQKSKFGRTKNNERLLSGGNVSMGFSSPQVTENSFQITRLRLVIWKEFSVMSGEEKSILTFSI